MILYIGEIQTGYFVEEVAKTYHQTVKFTGMIYRLEDIFTNSLKEKADYIIINISDLVYAGNNIVSVISRIKETASDSKIIIMAQGYLPNSTLIEECRGIGIVHFLFSSTLGTIKKELEIALNSSTDKDEDVQNQAEKPLMPIQPIVHPVHQNHKTIAVAGSLSRIGTTTQCLQIVKYYQSCGKKACYIEFNHTGFLKALRQYYTEAIISDDCLTFSNIHLYEKEQIENVLTLNDYDHYVYDYGVISELDQRVKASFLEKHKKIIVCGTSPTELETMSSVISDFYHSDVDYIFSFVPENEKKDTLENMGDRAERVYFSEYAPDAFFFSLVSIETYNKMLTEGVVSQADNKKSKRRLFGKKKG